MSEMRETPHLPPQPKWGVLSLTLMIIGLLILVPSGLCSGLFGIGALTGLLTGNVSEALSSLALVLMVGAIPVAIGGALVFVALRMRGRG